MIKCVRCGQMVDETERTTCPHCFTPLASAEGEGHPDPTVQVAPIVPMQLIPGTVIGNKRVSLTGELIEIDPPTNKPSYAGGTPAPPPPVAPPGAPTSSGTTLGVRKTPGVKGKSPASLAPMAPLPPPSSAPAPSPSLTANAAPPPNTAPRPASAPIRPASASSSKRSSSSGIIAVLLALVVLGAGGYWFMQNRTNPKDNAEKWLRALLTKDYKTVFELTNAGPKSQSKSAADWKKAMQTKADMGVLGQTTPEDLFSQLKAHVTKVDEPKTSDSGTNVPITVTLSVNGQEISRVNQVPMKKVNGVWKVDLPEGNINSVLKP